jgi:bifunctional oligoribonuclease and PAP phosphatase NrnA
MTAYRLQRIADQIGEEISALLLKGLKDPRIGFVTITGVEITRDLSQAFVFFSTPGTEEQRKQSREGLQSAAGFIRTTLGKRLHLKTIPELSFRYDKSLDNGDRIERLLSEVRKQEGWDDPTRPRGSVEELAGAINAARRFLVTSHKNPDGDAVASMLAMGHLLRSLAKEVVVYNPDAIPGNYQFLPGADSVTHQLAEESFDATVILDCSDLDRVGPLPPPERLGTVIGIDHHRTLTPLGKAYLLDPAASSVGELIDRLCQYMKIDVSLELATCIYTSILSDTGSFRYSNTSPAALSACARMLQGGVNPWEVALQVYESQPLSRIRLLALVLPTLEVDKSGRYGSIVITKEMFEKAGSNEAEIDGFINYPRGIEGVEVAIQFREMGADLYKVSFRSRGQVNVAEISEQFGGGGHANAAGCNLKGTLEEIRQRIYQAVEASLAE